MPILAREASVIYGGYSVGGSDTSLILRDIYVSGDSYETSTLEFTFTVQKDTLSAFATACAAAEAAFRVPHLATSVTGLGSKSFTTVSGFNALPNIHKFAHPSDSALARTYRVTIEMGRPADNSGSSGRRVTRTSVNVAYGEQRRRHVTISGEWTTLGSGARSQYAGQITSYANGILAGLTGTYKLLREPQTSQDDANNVIRISIEYEEILNTEVGGADAEIRAEGFVVSRQESQPGDTPNPGFVIRAARITAHYQAFVEKTNTALESKWATLRTSLLTKIKSVYGLGFVVIMHESADFDPTDNKITATMDCMGFPGNAVIECRASTEHDTEEGVTLVPVWNGDRWARYRFEGPASEVRTVHVSQRVVGLFFGPQGSPLTYPDQFSGRGDLVLKRTTTNATPEMLGGVRNTVGKQTSVIIETRTYERAKIIKGTGGPAPVEDPAAAVANGRPGTNNATPVASGSGAGGGDGSGAPR